MYYILNRADLEELIKDRVRLNSLENAGVDSWYGYELSYEVYEKALEDMPEILTNYEEVLGNDDV